MAQVLLRSIFAVCPNFGPHTFLHSKSSKQMETDTRSLMLHLMTIAAVICLSGCIVGLLGTTPSKCDVLTSRPHRTRFFESLVTLRLVSVAWARG